MKRRTLSLTERVVWAVTGTVALLVGLQSVLAFIALDVQEDELTDAMLRREVQQIVVHAAQPGLTPTGLLIESARLNAWLTRKGSGETEVPTLMRGLAPGMYHFATDGKTLHVAVADTADGRLTVVLDATESEARALSYGLTLFGIWIACVLVTVWVARRVAAVAVEPIVAATRDIARSALGKPLSETGLRGEAGVLMETFNRFRDRADDTIAREREFAANLDHEIRTPLTAIRTDAELLALEPTLSIDQQARLARITAAVDEISDTTEATLLQSAGRSGHPETIDLRRFLDDACAMISDRARARGLRIDVEVSEGESLQGDRQALLTIVRNLLRNATEHAAPATLTISGDHASLVFADDGPGIEPEVLQHVFDRHRRGRRVDEGDDTPVRRRGLGLAIARRLCELQGWALTAVSPGAGRQRGTSFVLRLTT